MQIFLIYLLVMKLFLNYRLRVSAITRRTSSRRIIFLVNNIKLLFNATPILFTYLPSGSLQNPEFKHCFHICLIYSNKRPYGYPKNKIPQIPTPKYYWISGKTYSNNSSSKCFLSQNLNKRIILSYTSSRTIGMVKQ